MRKSLTAKMTGIALILAFIVTGCTSNNSSQPSSSPATQTGSSQPSASHEPSSSLQPQKGGTITIGVRDEPDTLDVHRTGMSAANQILSNLGAGLVTFDSVNNEFKPYLAESWSMSDDGKTWTFKIRSDVKFHDGTPLTAKSFEETYIRATDSTISNKVSASNLASLQSVSASDDQTLVLQLKEPFAPLLQYLSDPGWLQPLSLAAIDKAGDQYGRNPIGVGPWKFDSWETGKSITFSRFEDFNWGDPIFSNLGTAYPDKLVYKFISDSQTMLAALESGSIDIASKVDAKNAIKYREDSNYEVKEMLHNGLGLFVMMNMKKPMFQDVAVRKAINQAINKDAMMKAVISGEGVIADGPIPPTFFGYDENVVNYGYKYSEDEAVKQLESSGYTKGSDGYYAKDGIKLSMELVTLPSGSYSQAAQLIQAMLKSVGIEVKIVSMELAALLEANAKGNYDLSVSAYTLNDPDALYLFFHSSQMNGGLNTSFVDDPDLDKLLEQGRAETNLDKRKEVYKQLQEYIVEKAYWVPIYVNKAFYVVRNKVSDTGMHPLRGLTLQDAWVNP